MSYIAVPTGHGTLVSFVVEDQSPTVEAEIETIFLYAGVDHVAFMEELMASRTSEEVNEAFQVKYNGDLPYDLLSATRVRSLSRDMAAPVTLYESLNYRTVEGEDEPVFFRHNDFPVTRS